MNDGQGVAAAKRHDVVRLADGRTARLHYWPAHSARRRRGARAVVILPSGAHLSIPCHEVTPC